MIILTNIFQRFRILYKVCTLRPLAVRMELYFLRDLQMAENRLEGMPFCSPSHPNLMFVSKAEPYSSGAPEVLPQM